MRHAHCHRTQEPVSTGRRPASSRPRALSLRSDSPNELRAVSWPAFAVPPQASLPACGQTVAVSSWSVVTVLSSPSYMSTPTYTCSRDDRDGSGNLNGELLWHDPTSCRRDTTSTSDSHAM